MEKTKRATLFDGSAAVLILTVVAGGIDAYTYMCRGNAFAGLQTGNLLQIGMKLAAGKTDELLNYILPVIVFAIGVALTSALTNSKRLEDTVKSRRAFAGIEVLLMLAAAFIPYGKADVAATLCLSLACAIQLHGFRTINKRPVTTTMSTGNLRGLSENAERFFATGDKKYINNVGYYAIMISGFVVGALGVGLLVTHTPICGIMLPMAVLAVSLIVDITVKHTPAKS